MGSEKFPTPFFYDFNVEPLAQVYGKYTCKIRLHKEN